MPLGGLPRGGGSDAHRAGAVTSSTMSETTATNQRRRLAWLDALRGFAALCVVFDHGSTLLLLPVRSFLYQWLNLGQYGVFVFFLVSGYIVPASLERKGSVRGFWISRAFRLYPMFLVALVLSAVAYETGHGTIANAGQASAGRGSRLAVHAAEPRRRPQRARRDVDPVRTRWSSTCCSPGCSAGACTGAAAGTRRPSRWARWRSAACCRCRRSAAGRTAPGMASWYSTRSRTRWSSSASGWPCSSRSWLARVGASLAAAVALVLVTFNQSYPYPWSGCVILALMFTGTLIYRAEQPAGQPDRDGGDRRRGARPDDRSRGSGTARATAITGRSSGRRRSCSPARRSGSAWPCGA